MDPASEGLCVLSVCRKASMPAASRGCLLATSVPRRAADAVVAAAAARAHQDPPAGPPHPQGPPVGLRHRLDLPVGPPHPTGAPVQAPVGAQATALLGAQVIARAGAQVIARVGAQATARVGARAIAPAGAQVPLGARATVRVLATAPVGAPLQTPMHLGAENCLCQAGSTAALCRMGRMAGSSSPLRPKNEGGMESSSVLYLYFLTLRYGKPVSCSMSATVSPSMSWAHAGTCKSVQACPLTFLKTLFQDFHVPVCQ